MTDVLNPKSYFDEARAKLTVRLWANGKKFIDDLYERIFEYNDLVHYKVTRSDVLNFLIIRQLVKLSSGKDISQYADRLSLINIKRFKSYGWKYLEGSDEALTSLVSATMPEPVFDFIDDLRVKVDHTKKAFNEANSIESKSIKKLTQNNIVQLIVFDTLLVGKDNLETDKGLTLLAKDLIDNYSYQVLID